MLSKNQRKLCDLLLFFGVLYLSLGPEIGHAQDKSDDVKKLLKERRDLLSQAVDKMTKVPFAGTSSFTAQEMIQADRESLKADLDWFDKPEDRIQAIDKHKKAADQILQSAKAKKLADRGLESNVLLANAYVVEVQIALLEEKEKQMAKSGK